MPALVAEGIKLLSVAQIESGLFAHPFAQALFQSAVSRRIEGTEGQGVFLPVMRHHQHRRPLAFDRQDGRRQTDGDNVLHSPTSGKAVVTPSSTISGGPMVFSAAIMRPPRPSAASAWETISRLGWAC